MLLYNQLILYKGWMLLCNQLIFMKVECCFAICWYLWGLNVALQAVDIYEGWMLLCNQLIFRKVECCFTISSYFMKVECCLAISWYLWRFNVALQSVDIYEVLRLHCNPAISNFFCSFLLRMPFKAVLSSLVFRSVNLIIWHTFSLFSTESLMQKALDDGALDVLNDYLQQHRNDSGLCNMVLLTIGVFSDSGKLCDQLV